MGLEWRNKWRNKEDILSKYIPSKKILVFDVETTGLGENSKIIQFSSILYEIDNSFSLQEIFSYDTYINPEEQIADKIVEITGITNDVLADAKIEADVAQIIFKIFNSADIVAGYNVGFDLNQLKRMSQRTGIYMKRKEWIDVCEMARDFVAKSDVKQHKLGNVVKFLFPDKVFGFHDAFEDVKATALIMEYFTKQYRDLQYETGKFPAHLEKAHLFINPKRPSMQRVYLVLSVGNDGDIFYDIAGHFWSCKSTAAAKKLFQQIDMCNIESQLYRKYITPFRLKNVDEMAQSWLKFRRAKQKERKQ